MSIHPELPDTLKAERLKDLSTQDYSDVINLLSAVREVHGGPSRERLNHVADVNILLGVRCRFGRVIGIVTMAQVTLPTCTLFMLKDLVTRSDLRGRGIGATLVNEACDIASRVSGDKEVLIAVPNANEETIEFIKGLTRRIGRNFSSSPATFCRSVIEHAASEPAPAA